MGEQAHLESDSLGLCERHEDEIFGPKHLRVPIRHQALPEPLPDTAPRSARTDDFLARSGALLEEVTGDAGS